MQFYKLITCCVIAGSFVACKSGSSEPTFDPSLVSSDSGKNNPAAAAQTANPANANVAPFVPTVNPTATGAPIINTTTTTVQPAVTAEGTNPPHGQPNHRCDIAVGAPLNSPPGKVPPAPVQTNAAAGAKVTQTATMTPVATTTKTAPGMNPPHGEPGHRCDIAVGAPLNSAPKKVDTPIPLPVNMEAAKAAADTARS